MESKEELRKILRLLGRKQYLSHSKGLGKEELVWLEEKVEDKIMNSILGISNMMC